jgi:xanthine/CO dehydrogenase XdhC/CoxF family maturation factor
MMIDNVRNNQIAQAMGKTALPHPGATSKPAADGSDATLQVSFADLISQAIQGSQTETDAVQKARELLQSGRLTSPENIRSAAQNILTDGI